MHIVVGMLSKLILIVALSYVLLCLFLFLVQRRLIFFPTKDVPDISGSKNVSEVVFPAADGLELWGLLAKANNPRGFVIFFHGNGGNVYGRIPIISFLADELKLNVLAVSYRGYGKCRGTPSERGVYSDAFGAYEFATKKLAVKSSKVVIFGRSLGGAVAIELASKVRPAGLVVESTFSSLPDVAAELYPLFPVRLIARYRFNSMGKVASMKIPKLMFHSPDDEIIPYSLGRKLFEKACAPKSFFDLKGGHNTIAHLHSKEYIGCWKAFLDGIGLVAEKTAEIAESPQRE